jgi:hypothetical protein
MQGKETAGVLPLRCRNLYEMLLMQYGAVSEKIQLVGLRRSLVSLILPDDLA